MVGGRAVRDAQAMRGAQQGSLISLAGRHLSDDFAAEQNNRPVANQAYFRKLGSEQQHRRACVGHLAQQPIDLVLGADIDAAGRIEAKQGLKPGGNPSRDHHLLLVAAAQPAQLGPRAGVDLQALDGGSDASDARYGCESGPNWTGCGQAARRRSRGSSAAAGEPASRFAGTSTRPAAIASPGWLSFNFRPWATISPPSWRHTPAIQSNSSCCP